MTTSTPNPPLSRLPPELRLMVWEAALPDPVVDPLYIWRYDCWTARLDETKNAQDEKKNELHIEFDPRPLDCYEVHLPHFSLNHEARWVALRWLEKQQPRLQIRYHKKTRRFSIVRPFDPTRDTVYVPYRQWFNFFPNAHRIRNLMLKAGVDQQLAHMWPWNPRPGHPTIVKHPTPLTRLAFPSGLLHKKGAEHVCPSSKWSSPHPECRQVSIVSSATGSTGDPPARFADIDVVHRTWEVVECPKEMKVIVWVPVHDKRRRWHTGYREWDASFVEQRRAKGDRFNADLDRIWSCRNSILNEDTGGEEYHRTVTERIERGQPLMIRSVVAVER
ncbi:uncharacterized protein BO95DRAFT_436116 [Aspergillus brunneoviolaceus CBS 621.78]|uniref:Uncharacterized protein n=1 Tax=Aspergillus brunneoviolaceus CBS 621.78 TaxID=1450534 RepID=A0ACD1FW09_9EURO|nr:hypothetical protein BO95DRAFT_436116 [Aspergillus brunneoviolaceus CBS 621.78]RAH41116.1 hypothetical protein BO95DRAFT_436116 [Aspergillus brunneoviolaceus CBS 621.78]